MRRRDPQAAQDSETLARVTSQLERALASHGDGAMISVAHVLDLANPRGLWRYDPEYRRAQKLPPVPAGSDPMTGCLPVTPAQRILP